MYRKLAGALIVASALQVKYAGALGLGEMTMHSVLNEPLQAEIKLTNVGDLDETQILINFASQSEFEMAGVDYSYFHSDIKFKVELDGKGGGVVKVYSKKRLNEPFLDFVLQAKWPTGRMLRSYTALVDLPVYAQPEPAVVSVAETQAPVTPEPVQVEEPAQVVEPEVIAPVDVSQEDGSTQEAEETAEPVAEEPVAEVPADEPVASPQPEVYSSPGTYRIQSNDTLWAIASQNRPSDDVSVQQTMLAIQRMNGHAFVDGNINRIKNGEVLRLPSAQDVRSLSHGDAMSEVANQNKQWQNAQLDATSTSTASTSTSQEDEEGSLRLTSSGSGQANGSAEDGSDVGALKQQLQRAKEELDAASRENNELDTRVESLEQQIAKLERLIELKDQQLADLQAGLGESQAQSAEDSVKAGDEAVEKTPVDEAVQEETVVETPEETTAAEAPKEDKPKQDKPKKQDKPVVEEKGIVDLLIENAIYIAGAGLLLILAVVGFIFGRRMKAEKQAVAELNEFSFDDDMGSMADDDNTEPFADAEQGLEDEDFYKEPTEEIEAVSSDDFDPEAVTAEDLEAEEQEAAPTTMQTGDAIGEADIYIAYGRYEQAAELLLSAIQGSPDDADLRNKLLEVYIESQDKDGFQQQFVEVQSRGLGDVVTHAKELLSSADGVSDWLDDLPEETAASVDTVDDADAFDDLGDVSLDEEIDLGSDSLDDLSGDLSEDVSLDDLGDFSEEASVDLDDVSLDDIDLDLDATPSEELDLGSDLSDELDLSGDLDLEDSLDVSVDTDQQTEEAQEAQEDSLDDLSLDFSDLEGLEGDSGAEPDLDVSLDEPADEEPLDLDGLDLGLNESAETVEDSPAEELDIDLDLDLGEDLSLDEPLAEESAEPEVDSAEPEVDDEPLELPDDFDLGLDSEVVEPVSTEETIIREAVSDIDTPEEPVFEEAEQAAEEIELDVSLDDEELSLPEEVLEMPVEEAEPELAAEEPVEAEEEVSVEAPAEQTSVESADTPAAEAHESSPLEVLEGEDLEFLTDADEVSTKLDLAKAYIDMGDVDGARDILSEVLNEGKEEQKAEATTLLESLD